MAEEAAVRRTGDEADRAWMCDDKWVFEVDAAWLRGVVEVAAPGGTDEMETGVGEGNEDGLQRVSSVREEIEGMLDLTKPGPTWTATVRKQKAAVMVGRVPDRVMTFVRKYKAMEVFEVAAVKDGPSWEAAVDMFLQWRRVGELDAQAQYAGADVGGGGG